MSGTPRPSRADIAIARGIAAAAAGRHAAAVTAFREALRTGPPVAAAHYNMGNSLVALGRQDEALAAFAAALAVDPAFARAAHNMAEIERRRGRLDAALALYDQAVAIEPGYARAHAGRGETLFRAHRPARAANAFTTALALDPSFRPALDGLARALADEGRTEAARAAYDLLAARDPAPGPLIARALLLPRVLDSTAARDRARDDFRAGIAALDALTGPVPPEALPGPPFFLCYQGLDDRADAEALTRTLRRLCPALSYTAPHVAARHPARTRARIGYVATFRADHTVGRLIDRVLDTLPADRFEVVAFRRPSDRRASGQRASGPARTVPLTLSLAEDQRRIANERLDALVFPEIGMDRDTWLLAFARFAPLQVATWGHPVTSGLDTIDAYVSGAAFEPADGADHYTERLVRLASVPFAYDGPGAVEPFDPSAHGIEPGRPLFACPQSLFKLHPDTDALFADVLRAVPDALILAMHWAEPGWGERLHARFRTAHGDVAGRLRLLPRLPHAAYLGLLQASVAALDPPHFTGGLTTLDALALGVPVVTLPGRFLRGRLSAGLLAMAGETATVANDATGYVAIAARLAHDPAWRGRIAETTRRGAARDLVGATGPAAAFATFLADAIAK